MSVTALACEGQRRETRRSGLENPIEEMLRTQPVARTEEGIAAAILVDTSGSMRDRVTDRFGKTERKLQVAQRCVTEAIRQFAEFSTRQPDRKILVGIYEFSSRDRRASCRPVMQLSPPDEQRARLALEEIEAQGGTPIGDAMILAKRELDATGLSRRHMLVITDGENNKGYAPGAVADALARQPEQERVSLYFVAFDIEAERFNSVKESGGLVLAADSEGDLRQTLDFVLTGRILVEQPVQR
jgi:Mg-chelatase subunit ChlD